MDTVVVNGVDFYFFVIFSPKNIREQDPQRTLVFRSNRLCITVSENRESNSRGRLQVKNSIILLLVCQ